MGLSKKNILIAAIAMSIFSGCVATSPALYTSEDQNNITVTSVEKIENIVPKDMKKQQFDIFYKAKNTQPNEDNYVNARGSVINLDKKSKVVIALPVETSPSINSTLGADVFKTEGYINKAEVVVEKELLRAGFDVIDRSKFEAKLRTKRENNSHKETLVYEKAKKLLDEKLKNTTISKEEYVHELAKLKETTQHRSRGQKELIDMSELIRAAGSKGVQADFILQLTTIEEYKGYKTQVKIHGNPDVENYLKNNPDVTYGDRANSIPYSFDTQVFRVVFAAKLFDVQTGKVVWTGSHELNSLDIENIRAIFNIGKKDINSFTINNEINGLNSKAMAIKKESVAAKNKLIELYNYASSERKYKDKEEQKIGEKRLKDNISKYENIIKSNNDLIKKFNLEFKNYNPEVKYQYIVSNLLIEPNLNPEKASTNQELKVILDHRKRLLSSTIRALFNTINVK